MKTCLVIEDSGVIREIIQRMVRDLGLEPREADAAAPAVELIRSEKPDVVLLDWDLPSMGALDFLRGVGALDPEARPEIVLCATENDHQQFTLASAAGARHHILKPFDKAALSKLLVAIGVLEVDETSGGEGDGTAGQGAAEDPRNAGAGRVAS